VRRDHPLKGRNVVVTGGLGALGHGVVSLLRRAARTCTFRRLKCCSTTGRRHRVLRELASTLASIHLAGGFAMNAILDTSFAESSSSGGSTR
jgi:hypothetical protein